MFPKMLIALQIIWIFLNAPQKINIMEYILINDSLNCDYNEVINIYVKMFKRKENKLYRIKYTKNTVTNTYNEIHLFHKRFERNRYMCEMWNNKNNNNKKYEILNKNERNIINNINNKYNLSNVNFSMEIHMDQFNSTSTDILNENTCPHGNISLY
ncbi:hypothetical protein PFUGPA_02137 [Plasmodium falciparum Palo Alto/Uganda]|uniref:Plasmodium falciparum erythrocyte membrane protein 1 acidic terminal segment domain-containing protein n=9 Tax=Plasmodium falciparum TaxID=5833 RepID=W4J1C6_PLAFP|nr:hypothetical protein PFFVO_03683 [Plasmodium falciparum Vietnam Oak-Knoll (FVO)]ETW56093.1 hypothetical protein PFUGPA_02137 [Plasmodium falciparum Palo Alto/Uganda]ETW60219.1 hypothetical protein PFMC_03991 [Plasmodium falciparum CAMP/Malaysia]